MAAMGAHLKINVSLLLKGQLTWNLAGSIGMTYRSKIAKIYFFASSPKPKSQLTPNLVGSIGVTYRSKIAKIIPIGNLRLRWPP